MHEIGMCEDVLAAVEQRARGRAVTGIGVRTGAMLRVVPEAFQQSFELVAAGSVAAGAQTTVTIVPVQATCLDCDAIVETVELVPACGSCGGVRLSRESGDELILEWVRYADAAPSAPDGAG